MQRITIAPNYDISRVIRGGWQLAGGHGAVDADRAVEDMIAFADAGITTFDCADIYTGVEELIGRFRLAYRNLRGAVGAGAHPAYTPNSCRIWRCCPLSARPMSRVSSTHRASGSILIASISCSFTGGPMTSRAGWKRQAG